MDNITEHIIDTERNVYYRKNEAKTKTNYGDEIKTDYRIQNDIDH